ncbi:metal dependent phosphohydrolase [Candidatus Vecturithrix granuli]|uniref:Metal dependent phosphohydrolase n=1 Tax=Vecturithrix granuli TaxID=1499967 RepID=A0A081BVT4_VECG1|nr:metal dependent phosphohydrolase [Candidatus Vecturithrix granuli]
MLNDQQKLQQLIDLGTEIVQIQDVDALLEKILSAARKLTNADAGTIYMKDGEGLQFRHAQNDTLQQRQAAGEKLIYKSFSVPINRYSIAGYVASTAETVNIPDVYQLNTDLVPYVFDRSYDDKARYRTCSMLTLPLKNRRNQIIGVMQLINAQNDGGAVFPFLERDIPLIKVFANHAATALDQAQMTRSEILRLIQVLTEVGDPEETSAHLNRVGAYAAEMYEVWARQKRLPRVKIETNVEILELAAKLHDIGKLAIPAHLRQKPGKLTPEEFKMMKQHTLKGAQMLLKNSQSLYEEAAAEIALNHHEYWDGSGYPGYVDIETGQALPGYTTALGNGRGKRGEDIPIFGRIVAIADFYDALSSPRAFRDALHENDILDMLRQGAFTHFDPDVLDIFFERLDAIRAIAQRFPNSC